MESTEDLMHKYHETIVSIWKRAEGYREMEDPRDLYDALADIVKLLVKFTDSILTE